MNEDILLIVGTVGYLILAAFSIHASRQPEGSINFLRRRLTLFYVGFLFILTATTRTLSQFNFITTNQNRHVNSFFVITIVIMLLIDSFKKWKVKK